MTEQTGREAAEHRSARRADRRFNLRIAPFVVGLALVSALASFAVFTGYTPILPTDPVVVDVFLADAVIALVLFLLVAVEAWKLIVAWRTKQAGARLHAYIVGLFTITAAVPAVIMAVVGSVALDRGLYPAFVDDVGRFIAETSTAAKLIRSKQCDSLQRDADLAAADLARARVGYTDRNFFQNFFDSRVQSLGFTTAVIIDGNAKVVERVETGKPAQIVRPSAADFQDARTAAPGDQVCFRPDKDSSSFVVLRYLPTFDGNFLYVERPLDPFTIGFRQHAEQINQLFGLFDAHRRSIQVAFIVMYGLLAAIMLLSAIWLGLSFANLLVAPIRRLINATDQVSSGNLYVQVPVRRSEGDLARLGETFNKMISELRLQQNRLIAASETIDERRLFTEAVLSGVPAAVIGVDAKGDVTVVNPSAQKLLDGVAPAGAPVIGRALSGIVPELADLLSDSRSGRQRLQQGQVTLARGSRERSYNVRVTSELSAKAERNFVVTLDDITDLVAAQRTSAWADVARRIAHEIKNPLTPIQLSAERLKRRYSKVITEGRDVFDQCTDTIIRQVEDMKRMVDEFSSFARMPKAMLAEDDLAKCVGQVAFLMRVGHPDVAIEEDLPGTPMIARFDRRLLSQALTNIVKNATEGVAAHMATLPPEAREPGRVAVKLHAGADGQAVIDVVDNGKGFPAENRQRLLEPYMTTRSEGTGLGLAIVAKILEDHGGGIELLDAPGHRGAHVRLHFPIDTPTPSEAATAPGPVSEKA
ncbi:sensor histidine kinase [Lichenibacterium ramalinae]|uniref:histidine kinase n=1 Tax=Lichenibacterium ramalinae TaxID=2316527 RepID=A0A4Q2RC54_9HYPH|nr:PAS domain-containing sensor histidine kinase [Lichenibacterium ramalinae]RYB05031.1 PAS domain-containing sensor histidine kinase [Lichenibacterium ramalinae]